MVFVNGIQGVLISCPCCEKCTAKNAMMSNIVREVTAGVRCANLVKFVTL